MKRKRVLGPFRLGYGPTRWNEKTVALGVGKRYDSTRKEWWWFIGICLWAVCVNIGIKKNWWK